MCLLLQIGEHNHPEVPAAGKAVADGTLAPNLIPVPVPAPSAAPAPAPMGVPQLSGVATMPDAEVQQVAGVCTPVEATTIVAEASTEVQVQVQAEPPVASVVKPEEVPEPEALQVLGQMEGNRSITNVE